MLEKTNYLIYVVANSTDGAGKQSDAKSIQTEAGTVPL